MQRYNDGWCTAFAFLAKQTMGQCCQLATEPAFDHSLRFSPDQLLSNWGGSSFTYLCATNRLSVWTFLSESSGSPCSWLSEMSSDTSECCMKLERGGRERKREKWSALQNWKKKIYIFIISENLSLCRYQYQQRSHETFHAVVKNKI